MEQKAAPYTCHIFVCSNLRDNPDRPGCGAVGGGELKAVLKKMVNERGWKGRVRVSTSGCMGLCATGPNVLVYPQGLHFYSVTEGDLPVILDSVQSGI